MKFFLVCLVVLLAVYNVQAVDPQVCDFCKHVIAKMTQILPGINPTSAGELKEKAKKDCDIPIVVALSLKDICLEGVNNILGTVLEKAGASGKWDDSLCTVCQ